MTGRKVEKRVNKGWKSIEFRDLDKEDVFRISDPHEEGFCKATNGRTVFKAKDKPFINSLGFLQIEVEK